MLLVVPEVPGRESPKPLVQGFGCRLRDGALSCEALFVHASIPDQELVGELHQRGQRPRRVLLEWSDTKPGLYQKAEIDIAKEAP